MEQELSSTPARLLDKFIEDNLLPDTRFRAEVQAAINIMCKFLKEECFQGANHNVRVCKVVKGGSLGKGTDVNGRSDAELVIFVNNLNSFEDQLKKWGEFIQEIKKQLRKLQRENLIRLEFVIKGEQWPNSLALNFRLRSPDLDQEMEFDVLLAYDILGKLDHVSINKKSMIKIYREFIATCTSLGLEGEFSTCFTELQQNFLKDRPDKLKSLIRLVKHWYQLCEEKLGKPLPHQYALELLTVYAWERGSRAPEFNTAQGFRTVLELVKNQRHLQIYWTVYYDFEDEDISNYLQGQLERARPLILDPADPTRNVAGGNPGDGVGCTTSAGHVGIYGKPDPEIYGSHIRECTSLGKEGEFSTCFTELQRNFLKQRPPKLKSLIRLVKHWYQLVWHLAQPP